MPFVSSGSAKLYYEAHGAGPALVFAHGLSGHTLFYYQQVPYFARTYRVVLFDHRGFGRSACPLEDVSPEYFVEDLASILDAEAIERAALACQSMGGLTGLPFALRHPNRVTVLVLASSPGGIRTDRVSREFAASIPKRGKPDFVLSAPSFAKRAPDRFFLGRQLLSLYPPTATNAIVPRLRRVEVTAEQLRGYTIPTLVIAGTEDPLFSPRALREVADRIPGAKFAAIRGAGHTAYAELPEDFNRIVDRFIRAHVGEASPDRPRRARSSRTLIRR